MADMQATEIVTPPVRLSFPALFEARAVIKGSETKKFQATLLIPPDVDRAPFFECVKAAMIDKWGRVIKIPARNNPVKDCGEKDLAGYEDDWSYINAKSNYQPAVVDRRRQEILDTDAIYPGCWCRFHLSAYAWEHPTGGKGVSFSLNSVQFVKDDDRLDGRKSVSDVFDALDGDDDMADVAGSGESSDADDLFL